MLTCTCIYNIFSLGKVRRALTRYPRFDLNFDRDTPECHTMQRTLCFHEMSHCVGQHVQIII